MANAQGLFTLRGNIIIFPMQRKKQNIYMRLRTCKRLKPAFYRLMNILNRPYRWAHRLCTSKRQMVDVRTTKIFYIFLKNLHVFPYPMKICMLSICTRLCRYENHEVYKDGKSLEKHARQIQAGKYKQANTSRQIQAGKYKLMLWDVTRNIIDFLYTE